MTVTRLALVAGAALACGVVAVELLHLRTVARLEAAIDRLEAAAERAGAGAAPPVGAGACAAVVDPATLESALQRALAALPASPAPGASPVSAGSRAPPLAGETREPDPGRVAAMDAALARGRELVRTAQARGAWGDDDSAALRPVMAELDAARQQELLHALVIDLNSGRIRLETQGPPF